MLDRLKGLKEGKDVSWDADVAVHYDRLREKAVIDLEIALRGEPQREKKKVFNPHAGIIKRSPFDTPKAGLATSKDRTTSRDIQNSIGTRTLKDPLLL